VKGLRANPFGFRGSLAELFTHLVLVDRAVDYLLIIIYVCFFGINTCAGCRYPGTALRRIYLISPRPCTIWVSW